MLASSVGTTIKGFSVGAWMLLLQMLLLLLLLLLQLLKLNHKISG